LKMGVKEGVPFYKLLQHARGGISIHKLVINMKADPSAGYKLVRYLADRGFLKLEKNPYHKGEIIVSVTPIWWRGIGELVIRALRDWECVMRVLKEDEEKGNAKVALEFMPLFLAGMLYNEFRGDKRGIDLDTIESIGEDVTRRIKKLLVEKYYRESLSFGKSSSSTKSTR